MTVGELRNFLNHFTAHIPVEGPPLRGPIEKSIAVVYTDDENHIVEKIIFDDISGWSCDERNRMETFSEWKKRLDSIYMFEPDANITKCPVILCSGITIAESQKPKKGDRFTCNTCDFSYIWDGMYRSLIGTITGGEND